MAFLTVVTHQPIFCSWEPILQTPPTPELKVCKDRMRGGFSYNIMRHHCGFLVLKQQKRWQFFIQNTEGFWKYVMFHVHLCRAWKVLRDHLFWLNMFFLTNHLLVMNMQGGHFIHAVSWSKDPRRCQALKIQPGFFFAGGKMNPSWHILFNWVSSTTTWTVDQKWMEIHDIFPLTNLSLVSKVPCVNFHDWEETPPKKKLTVFFCPLEKKAEILPKGSRIVSKTSLFQGGTWWVEGV